tara:strand:+ start:5257 stop:6450 length:1194 start_codon:yes stop_codon:yes gene_type:complete
MKITIPDKVSEVAAKIFKEAKFSLEQKPGIDIAECNEISKNADAIVVRSYNLHELEFSDSVKAIGRAGAGVNNIPIDKCTGKGVVVFNTPGANANAVKELVLCSLLLSSRGIVDGINWTDKQEVNEELANLVEKNKSRFKGNEIKGKTLGVIGLGAIGMLIANDASALGMEVIGYDPHISVDNAWKLSVAVKKATDLNKLLEKSDYISVNVPLVDATKGLFNKKTLSKVKQGVKIMNFSRGPIVNEDDLKEALDKGIVGKYITDFPSEKLHGVENVILVPHLGASTKEAEENCAIMVSEQIIDYLENGNITSSVNFPECNLGRNGSARLSIINKNIPAMIEKITAVLAEEKLNIEEMLNKSKGGIAYNIVDVNGDITEKALEKIKSIEGILRVRKLI